ncbi:hypothetical protein [Pseudactinotalea sp. HY160]|nr:hypothetical protein [Pseudactinotalea sp. HY160]
MFELSRVVSPRAGMSLPAGDLRGEEVHSVVVAMLEDGASYAEWALGALR